MDQRRLVVSFGLLCLQTKRQYTFVSSLRKVHLIRIRICLPIAINHRLRVVDHVSARVNRMQVIHLVHRKILKVGLRVPQKHSFAFVEWGFIVDSFRFVRGWRVLLQVHSLVLLNVLVDNSRCLDKIIRNRHWILLISQIDVISFLIRR